jgi:Arc/MetJ family transcription regulator
MRTNIVIDDELMAKAMKATGLKTKRETVELALERLVDLDAQLALRSLRGKIKWVGDLDEMRRD